MKIPASPKEESTVVNDISASFTFTENQFQPAAKGIFISTEDETVKISGANPFPKVILFSNSIDSLISYTASSVES